MEPQWGRLSADGLRSAEAGSKASERALALTALLGQAHALVSRLSADRDSAVRALRGEGASYADIAKLLGVSRSRAQQLAERLAPDREHREGGRAEADGQAQRVPAGAGLERGSVAGGDRSLVTANANGDRLMLPGQVAQLFGVNPRTITRWATTGQLACVETPSGRRKYREADVEALRGRAPQATQPDPAGRDTGG